MINSKQTPPVQQKDSSRRPDETPTTMRRSVRQTLGVPKPRASSPPLKTASIVKAVVKQQVGNSEELSRRKTRSGGVSGAGKITYMFLKKLRITYNIISRLNKPIRN